MKKYVTGLVAIALALGFSAFTSIPENSGPPNPYWYKINPADNFKVVQVLGQRTQQSAQDASGCQNTLTTECVRGYSSDPGYSVGDPTAVTLLVIKKSS